ncbi:MAG: prohibitin family protein [Erysipelotrichaceae bacterium]|nr:prohibitin family protein [Erysipelotrichaceae bacterium]
MKKVLKVSLIIAGLVLVLIFSTASVKTVPTGHTGVVTLFGAVQENTLEAGVHVMNPFKKVIKIDNRVQKNSTELNVFSSDIQEVDVVYTVNYQIQKENAQKIYKTIGLSYYDTAIAPKVTETVKAVMAQYTAEALVSSRAEVSERIEKQLKESLAKYNIEVVATSIENLDFTDAFTDAVEAKQVAEQNKLKAQTEAETKVINAQAAADVKLIEAKAEAEANELKTNSLSDKLLREQYIQKWNGVLPEVVSENSTILKGLSE